MCARRRSNFLLSRQEKVTKEKATLLCASLRCAAGNLRCSVRGCHRRTRCAPAALRSNNCGESVHEVRMSFGTRTHPLPCASRHAQKGTQRTSIRAIALLGPVCAARGACAREMGPSEAMARGAVRLLAVRLSNPLLAAPAAGLLRGGTRVGARVLRELTRRGCPSGAAQQQSEFHGAPRNRHDAGLPLRTAKGSQTGGRLSFAYFSLAKQRKVSRPPGRQPGSRPQHKHALQTSTPRLQQAQPERLGSHPDFNQPSPNSPKTPKTRNHY